MSFEPGFYHLECGSLTPVKYTHVPDWRVFKGRDLLTMTNNIRAGQHIYFELQSSDKAVWETAMTRLKC